MVLVLVPLHRVVTGMARKEMYPLAQNIIIIQNSNRMARCHFSIIVINCHAKSLTTASDDPH